jgi:chaperonin GroEL (HSP60 family)
MQLVTGQAARRVSLASLAPVVQAIGVGLGPDKRRCLYSSGGAVEALQNGRDIARFSSTEDGALSVMPRILNEILNTAERELGDGTSRLALLIYAMFKEAVLSVERGVNRQRLAERLRTETQSYCDEIKRSADMSPCLESVGVTAGADGNVSKALAELAGKIGCEGTIEVTIGGDEAVTAHTEDGLVVEASAVLPGMQVTTLSSAHVLVANEIIDDFGRLVPILELFASHGKALLIVARDVTGAALQTLAANRSVSNLRVAAFRPTAVSLEAAEILRDLAVATNAQLICSEEGTSLSNLRPSMLGQAAEFRYMDGRLLLSGPAGDPDAVADRCRMLRADAERKRYLSLDRERLERRAARLGGHFGELRIGSRGLSDAAASQAVARRAAAAVLSAARGGVIVGGTKGLAKIANRLSPPQGDVATAARRCLFAGIQSLDEQIQRNRIGEVTASRDPARAVAQIAGIDADSSIQDPCVLLSQIFSRAASASAVFILSDTLLSR